MIRKGQLTPGLCPFAQFTASAAQQEITRPLLPLNKEIRDRTVSNTPPSVPSRKANPIGLPQAC